MADKKSPSRGYRHQAAPATSQRPVDTAKLPHLDAFPRIPDGIKPTEAGNVLLEPAEWTKTIGAQAGISDPKAVEHMCKAGHLPAIRMIDLPMIDEGPVRLSDNTKRNKILILTDPNQITSYFEPKSVRAVVYADAGKSPVRVPTNVRTDLYASEEAHSKAAKEAIAVANAKIAGRTSSYMVAWMVEREGQDYLRVVQHFDAKGAPRSAPDAKLEASVMAYDRMPFYSGEMLRKDNAAAIARFLGKQMPQPAGAASDSPTPPAPSIQPGKVTPPASATAAEPLPGRLMRPIIAEPQAPKAAEVKQQNPAATPPSVATPPVAPAAVATPPATAAATPEAATAVTASTAAFTHPDAEAMAASRAFDPNTPPRRDQAHILVIYKTEALYREAISSGQLRRSAGVASNYVGLLPHGRSSKNLTSSSRQGLIEPGAQIVAAVQDGDGACRLVAAMPYAGMDPGSSPKNAILLGHAQLAKPYPAGTRIVTGVRNLVPGAIVVSPSGGDAASFADYTGEIRAKIAKDITDSLGCP